jgi:hypothetical protein
MDLSYSLVVQLLTVEMQLAADQAITGGKDFC